MLIYFIIYKLNLKHDFKCLFIIIISIINYLLYDDINKRFSLFSGCSSVVPGSDYAYNPAYTQYGGAYGSYGYGTGSGLISN